MKRTIICMIACLSMSTFAAISRKTYVKVINNTPFEITASNFKVPVTFSDKADPAKKVHIKSGQIAEKISSFERNVGVQTGKTYEFGLTLTLPYVGPVLIEQKIVGKPINSTMYLSARSGDSSTAEMPVAQQWKEATRDRSSITLKKDNHTFIVSFNAYNAGPGTDDVWYTVDYRDEDTYNIVPVSSNGLNVLVYNIAGLIAIPRFQLGQHVRAGIIPEEIGNKFDAVIICEAYEKKMRDPLIAGLKQQGYQYISKVVGLEEADALGTGVGATLAVLAGPLGWIAKRLTADVRDGGVLIASKWPIVRQNITIFKDCNQIDCNANKGAIHVEINKNGKKYHIVGLHTNARWGKNDGTDRIRKSQFQQTYEFIKAENIPAQEPVIIGGDLNVNMYTGNVKKEVSKEYRQMLEILKAAHPPLDGPYKYTWDPTVNKLDPQENLEVKELLDYALYSTEHRKPIASFNRVMLFKARTDWADKINLKNQTTLFDLSDHFPVYGHFVFEGY